MKRDLQKYIADARSHYDKILDEKISTLVELTGIPQERFIRINPCDFLETISGMVQSNGNIGKYIETYKTPETYLISPLDEVKETANQIAYKNYQIKERLRAHKCKVVPIAAQIAKAFYVRNHRQTAANITRDSISFALVYESEIVACMTYDKTAGAVRGHSRANQYELLRLALRKDTQINGGASKLQAACEQALLALGETEIFSYSNATINEGGVYEVLGFKKGKIQAGRAYVIMPDFRLEDAATFQSKYGTASNEILRRYALVKVHIGGNRIWTKRLTPQS